jgi:hypothetical protein
MQQSIATLLEQWIHEINSKRDSIQLVCNHNDIEFVNNTGMGSINRRLDATDPEEAEILRFIKEEPYTREKGDLLYIRLLRVIFDCPSKTNQTGNGSYFMALQETNDYNDDDIPSLIPVYPPN